MPLVYTNTVKDPAVLVATTLANLRLNQGGLGTNDYGIAFQLGNTAAFDQTIRVFGWDPASTAADDGSTVVKPTAIDASDPGRWRRP